LGTKGNPTQKRTKSKIKNLDKKIEEKGGVQVDIRNRITDEDMDS